MIVGSTSATEAGVGTANTVFEVSVDGATGIVTLTQHQQIDHDVAETAPAYDDDQQFLANGLVSLTATAVTTDGDGDTATDSESVDLGGGNLRFDDDGPSATENDGADLDRLVVDESADDGFDPDGDNEAPEGTDVATAVFSDNFTTPIDYGADGPGTARYSLSLIGIDVASRLYALDPAAALGQGNEIVLNHDAVTGVVTGSAPDSTGRVTDYFTISIDEITGDVTFTRLANVWHSDTANDDDQSTLTLATASDLSVVQTVTDGDGDSDSDSVAVGDGVFVIEDDGPDDFTPADASFVNTGNETVMGVLGVFGNVGTDGLGGTTFVNNAGDNILRDTSNVAVTTSDTGATVYLHGFGTDTLVATTSMTAPSSPTGTPEANWVFRMSLDPDDVVQAHDKYTIEMFQKLDDGSGLDFTDLSGVESGNNQFLYAEGPAAAPTDDPDLVITALAPAVPLEDVNTSQGNIFPSGSIGVGNGQSIANGEGVRFDFVDNAIETPTTDFKDIADLDFTDFNPVNGVNFQVGQFKGGITEATVTVTLWDIDKALISTNNANFGMSSVIGTAVNVAFVTINGVLASPSQVTITGNSVVITCITAREDVQQDVQVFGVGTFDRAEVVNTGSGRYDMGFIETATSGDGTDLDMAFDVQLADADGDTVLSTDQLDVTLTPEGTAGAGATIIGGDSADVLVGSDGDDTITGNAGDDTITGGGGDDFFAFGSGAGDDVILDFSAGDTIDLDALFDVLDPTRADPANIDVVITNGLDLDGDGNNDDSLIQATTDGGATTVADFSIQVDDYTITGTDIDEGGV